MLALTSCELLGCAMIQKPRGRHFAERSIPRQALSAAGLSLPDDAEILSLVREIGSRTEARRVRGANFRRALVPPAQARSAMQHPLLPGALRTSGFGRALSGRGGCRSITNEQGFGNTSRPNTRRWRRPCASRSRKPSGAGGLEWADERPAGACAAGDAATAYQACRVQDDRAIRTQIALRRAPSLVAWRLEASFFPRW
jgi:hypothetical protein